MEQKTDEQKKRHRAVYWTILICGLFVGAVTVLFFGAFSYFGNEEHQRAQNRVSLYHSTLIGALQRFEHLPFILAHDPFVIAGASGQDLEGLNARLANFAQSAHLDAIYLMDNSGMTISASNYDADVTFLAQNYGFRPYFKDALLGKRGEFFGIGATTSKPGYFIAERVKNDAGDVLGVIALKLDLSNLTQAWREGGEAVFVSNDDGVVVLASDLSWRYKVLNPISEDRRFEILQERQFAGELLQPLVWEQFENDRVDLNGKTYIYASAPVSPLGWTIHFLADENRVLERVWLVMVVATIVALGLLLLAIYLRAERIGTALIISQEDRRLLQSTNATLAQEIEERRLAEARLEKAQTELAQSSKLAALGQLSASVTHELGQPITAMQNYLAAAEFDVGEDDRQTTLQRLQGIARRMVAITKQLRFFALPGKSEMERVDLNNVWEGAHRLLQTEIENEKIHLIIELDPHPVLVLANRLRLEQVVVNLLRNSILAMENVREKNLHIKVERRKFVGVISLNDSGRGLGDKTLDQLKEPFHSSAESGRGMGLGLAISSAIITEHDGRLVAENNLHSGATFIMELPLFIEGKT